MKKFKLLIVFMITIFMTGCVKLNANMQIHKDKSMDYRITMAFDKSLSDNFNEQFDDESIENAEKNGFKATEYDDGTMKGYTFTKHIKNIDTVSTDKDIKGSLDVDSNNKYLFTVKKSFLKNTYKAKLTTNTDLSNLNLQQNSTFDSQENSLTENSTNSNLTEDTNTTSIDYNSMANLDLKFEVTLPHNAINSNASSNSGKKLTWNLLTFKNDDTIEFEFELYNYQNILIIGIIVFIVLILIVLILNRKGKNNKDKDDNTISIDNNFGQANNISNVEEMMQAQDVWTDDNIQTVQPPTQNINQQPNPNQQNPYNQN